MKIAITIGSVPAFPLGRNLAGLWRAGRFWPKGRTVVEVVEVEPPPVEVLLPNSLREGHVEQRPDPLRLSLAAFAQVTSDPRIDVEVLDGNPSEQAGGEAA